MGMTHGKRKSAWATAAMGVLALTILSACNKTEGLKPVASKQAHINTKTKFASKDYGVKGSPRVTTRKKVRKGGGRYQIGKPYKIRGRWYKPKLEPGYNKVGLASWYGPNFHGRLTANGEIYDQYSLSAAHPTMPLPSYAKVTNLENGASVTVRVNDRGPFARGRIIDLSAKAAKLLDYEHKGLAKVRVKYLGKARMDGLDERVLVASYKPPKGKPGIVPGASFPGTLFAAKRAPEPSIVTALQSVGVPSQRPATVDQYDGIPIILTEAPQAPRKLLTPLAYGRDAEAQAPSHPAFETVLSKTEFHIASFDDLEQAEQVAAQFEPLGTPVIQSGSLDGVTIHSVSLTALELRRERVLQLSRTLGLAQTFEIR